MKTIHEEDADLMPSSGYAKQYIKKLDKIQFTQQMVPSVQMCYICATLNAKNEIQKSPSQAKWRITDGKEVIWNRQ